MRISSALPLLLLAGCGSNTGSSTQVSANDTGERVACAHGAAALTKDCVVDRTSSRQGLVLTVRHPDGAFRRLLVTGDGHGVVAADGSQPAKVSIEGQDIAVAIGGDRYLLPATIRR